MTLTYEDMIARAERLERYAQRCRQEGVVQGPEGAEDAETAALDWRRAAEGLQSTGELPASLDFRDGSGRTRADVEAEGMADARARARRDREVGGA